MICETCRGARLINGLPCSNCGGSGLDYCCGGTPVQPEKEEIERRTKELDLPIKRVKFAGPALEAHEKRKETDNNDPVRTADLRSSFERVKNSLLAVIKTLITTPPRS